MHLNKMGNHPGDPLHGKYPAQHIGKGNDQVDGCRGFNGTRQGVHQVFIGHVLVYKCLVVFMKACRVIQTFGGDPWALDCRKKLGGQTCLLFCFFDGVEKR